MQDLPRQAVLWNTILESQIFAVQEELWISGCCVQESPFLSIHKSQLKCAWQDSAWSEHL